MINTRDALMTFSEELTKKMISRGVTHRQVAFAARVTRESMSRYKNGVCFPRLWTMVLIADYLKCGVSELLGYSDGLSLSHEYNAARLYTNEDVFIDYFRDRLMQQMRIEHVNSEQLAEKSGLSLKDVKMYLSIHRWIPTVPEFLHICSALNCTPSDLLGY